MPTKQQPCPCGSGKAYRKCCGKPAAGAAAGPRLVGLPDGRRLPVAQVIQGAMSLHQAGRLDQAAELYRRVLEMAPREADALHLLGLVERQQGRLSRALELSQSAISARPGVAMFHSNLREALRTLERPRLAVDAAR